MTIETEIVSATKEIPVAASTIFELLRNPQRHAEADATGTVKSPETGELLREVGDIFVMNMSNPDMGEYQTKNEVFAFKLDQEIGWENLENITKGVKVGAKWLYELEELDPNNTKVTLTYNATGIGNDDVRKMATEKFAVVKQLETSLDKLAEALS